MGNPSVRVMQQGKPRQRPPHAEVRRDPLPAAGWIATPAPGPKPSTTATPSTLDKRAFPRPCGLHPRRSGAARSHAPDVHRQAVHHFVPLKRLSASSARAQNPRQALPMLASPRTNARLTNIRSAYPQRVILAKLIRRGIG